MRLSDYHQSHGLDVVVASKKTGERLHLRFEKGQHFVPCLFSAAGHHGEAGFRLVPAVTGGELDLEVQFVMPGYPGAAAAPAPPLTAEARPAPSVTFEPADPPRVRTTSMAEADDGAPMIVPTSDEPVRVLAHRDVMAMPADPTAEVMASDSTAALVAGGGDRLAAAAEARKPLLPHEVHVPDYDETPAPDPMEGEMRAAQAEQAKLIEESKKAARKRR